MCGKFVYSILTICLGITYIYTQPARQIPKFELGGDLNYLKPREDYYHPGWGIQLHGVWNLSYRYGINLTYSSTVVDSMNDEGSSTFQLLMGILEMSFRAGDIVKPFTSLGVGKMFHEDDPLFIFGVGIKIPLTEKMLIRAEIKDLHSDLGIPFLSFPEGQAALSGRGYSKYFTFDIGIAILLGEKEVKRGRGTYRRH